MLRSTIRRLLALILLAGLLPWPAPSAAQAEPPNSETPQTAPLNALLLAGTDGYVNVPYSAELNTLSDLTIEAWVYRNNTLRNETILGNGWQDSYWFGFSSTGKLRSIIHGSDSIADSASTVNAGKWTHVAITYDGLTRNFYINGVLDRTTTEDPGAITGNTGQFLGIGFDSDPFSSNYFDGIVDEVRLWNTARTPQEIQSGMFQTFAAPLPASLVGYWQLDGNTDDETGDHDGALMGGLGSSSWTTDSAIPHDIRIPQIGTTPSLDGQCGPSEYANASVVAIEGATILLQHTASDLWVCFDFYVNSNYTSARLYLDPNHDRLDPAQPDDLRFDVADDDTLTAYTGNDAGQWVVTTTFNTLWDGDYAIYGPSEFPYYNAEFRIDEALTGGWGSLIGLAADPYDPGPIFTDLAGIWPPLAVSNLPSTWSSATLAGVGPQRTFSGRVEYQPKDLTLDPSGVQGATLELYGYDTGGSEALVAAASSGYSGAFSLTTNDDFTNHRLELITTPQGYLVTEADAPAPGEVLDPRSIDYAAAGGGSYPNNIFTLGDPVPQNINAPYGPVFLILAPQSVIESGALEAFRSFKVQQGFAVSIRSAEDADAYPGATRLEKVRALEQEYLQTYGDRFQYVMLVGGDNIFPFAKMPIGATGAAGTTCPSDDPPNYKFSEWLYVDLTSNFDSNGNGCYADGTWAPADKLVAGYTPDSGILWQPDVILGRIPFDDPNTIRKTLANSIGFESQTESYKLNALNGMSMLALKGYFEGAACDGDNWGDHCVSPVPNDQSNYDTALVSEQMIGDYLAVNGFATTVLYENEEEIAGGQGILSPEDLTALNVREELDAGRFGLATMTGHGSSTGVYRNFWVSDKNNNGVVDVSDSSYTTELSEVTFFSIDNTLDHLDSENGRGGIFVLLACSNASPANADNLAATILAGGHGPASVAALSVVTVGSWFNENDYYAQSIGYYVNKRLVSNSYRLGEAVWWTLADLVKKGKSGSGGVAYELYGDPTLSFFANPGGQTTLAAWPMGRRDAAGASYLSLPGPTYPKQLWEYTAGPHAADTLAPSPIVGNENEVIIASGQYVDVLRQGALYQRLYLDASVFGSPALSADGTIYVMDQNADLYAFARQRFTWNGVTSLLDSRTRRWKVDLGENPQASPTVGSDGFILAGVGGPLADDPRLWLVRPDGIAFSSFALHHNPLYYAATDASRTLYVATGVVSEGHLYRFTQFCDTFVNPDVCPTPSWTEITNDVAYNTPPLLAYGALYIGDVEGNLFKIDPTTLAVQATFTADSAIELGPIASPNGDVLFVSSQGVMYSLTKNLNIVRWQKNLGSTSPLGIPAASVNAIYLAFDGYLRAYNPSSGAQLWKRSLGEEIGPASVAVGFGREVYVQGVDGTVLAFGEGWGIRPARVLALPGIINGRSQFVRLDILQSLPPISTTLTLDAGPLPASDLPTAEVAAILVQRSIDGSDWEDVAILDPGTTVFTDTNLAPDASYQYRIQNLMSDGKNSDFVTADAAQTYPEITDAPALDPVETLAADSLGLVWSAPAGVVDTYRVERGLSAAGPFTAVITLTSQSVSWQDTGLAPNTAYHYRVIAGNISGESDPSNIEGATTRSQTLAAPENVQIALAGSDILLTWNPGPAGASAVIEINLFGEAGFSPAGSEAADGFFAMSAGEPTAYTFRVKFVQGNDESPWTQSASVVISQPQLIYLPLVRR